MKKQIQDAFEQITMPDTCVQEVTKAMNQKQERKSKSQWGIRRPGVVVAAALSVVLIGSMFLSTEVQATMNELVQYVFRGMNLEVELENGEVIEIFEADATDDNLFHVLTVDGKLYLSANGEYLDITDKTSMETPYIHTYVDSDNVEHLLMIGGTPENFGISEFYRTAGTELDKWGGWVGGYSENYLDNATGKAYPWLAAAWEELDLPWPMPGE